MVRASALGKVAFNRRARLKALGCAVGLIAVASTSPFAASHALAKCWPNRPDNGVGYWDGWYNDADSVGGVYSTIFNYSPWVQPNNEVSAWSMLTLQGAGDSYWAQVGWWEYAYGQRYTFAQWTIGGGGWQDKWWDPEPDGTYSTYTTLWQYQPGMFTFQLNGNTIDSEVADFPPNEAQVMGEIHTLADQMPGGYYAPEDFSNTAWYVGGWAWFDGYPMDNDTGHFNIAKYSSSDLQIGDQACPY